MKKRNIFSRVSNLSPGRSVFDLSYSKLFTCDMGMLIPVMADEVVPGDIFKIGNQIVIRFQPLVAPILHEINVYVHYFFVPYRLLWDEWETFITGDFDGEDLTSIPTWTPTSYAENSLWDYLGMPVDVVPTGTLPVQFPMNAYNLIYNEYYNDENLASDQPLTNNSILYRKWEKDYFTSALPWQQRGTAPALPLSGTTNAQFSINSISTGTGDTDLQFTRLAGADPWLYANDTQGRDNVIDALSYNTVDFADAATFDVADLRLAFQIQKWMERNARAGVRYTEFLKSHFGVAPRDERLQRPEYIGGTKSPVIISEVLQTSETADTPQGNLAGHGLGVSEGFVGKYRASEFGLIMGIMSVMPKPMYSQGVNRQWIKETRYDFYFPEFANLSEQAIYRGEIYAVDANPTSNQTIFGYQGRYDEMRTKQNMVCAGMRSTFNYWHLGREFSSAPSLNNTFISANNIRKDIFADEEDHGLIVNFANIIKALRPIPIQAEPGLIDHS